MVLGSIPSYPSENLFVDVFFYFFFLLCKNGAYIFLSERDIMLVLLEILKGDLLNIEEDI